ncbi:unnamed protein product [Moneuplotes crassus]|uniref:Uncharacterized protein n=1 Tax=Euplotes crassus TaxID=5936 RepID=A0AAD1U3C2_EUPCR|nr:unnamed protein product [Moneuplotes crassus]
MGNKTVGKKVDRPKSKAVIKDIDLDQFKKFTQEPREFLNGRLEFRDNLEEWGYMWAHRLLEDSFVRSSFEIEKVLKSIIDLSLTKNDLTICDEGEALKPKLSDIENHEYDLQELQRKLNQDKKDQIKDNSSHALQKAMILTRKILWHVRVVGIGMAAMGVVLEGEKHDEMIHHMEQKVGEAKKEYINKIFELRVHDFKTQFFVMKKIFDKVIYGEDDEILKKSRLDSAFVICEELFLLISEPQSELYKSAHMTIDLVSCFMIIHLGMLQLAVECYDLNDHKDKLNYCCEFYPMLIKSYIDQAISNYVKPIILNYHNQVSRLTEMEEIYYEMNNSIIYTLKRNSEHIIWNTTREEMTRDRMFYNFKEGKLKFVEPSYLIGPEPPLLCRALRYGVALKLEDLYTPYSASIDQIVYKLKNTVTEETEMGEIQLKEDSQKVQGNNEENGVDLLGLNEPEPIEEDKEEAKDEKLETLSQGSDDSFTAVSSRNFLPDDNLRNRFNKEPNASPVRKTKNYIMNKMEKKEDLKCNFVSEDNYHYNQCIRVEQARKTIAEVRKKAREEQKLLNELYSIKAKQYKYDEMTENFSRLIFMQELYELMIDDEELYTNLSEYMIFHHENKRVKYFSNLE